METLTPEECHALAWAALHACEPHKAWAVAADRLEGCEQDEPADASGWWFDLDPAHAMHGAMLWARDATEFQRRVYAMACLAPMTEEERHAIVRPISLQEVPR